MPKGSTLVIAITGTPGAGKTTFARSLSKKTGIKPIEVNEIVEAKRLFTGVDKNGSKIVKMQELKNEISQLIKKESGAGIILVGHLLADLKLDYDISVVVRSNLKGLIGRMQRRGYSKEKLKENLVSESINYCGVQAAERSKETYEVETEADRSKISGYIKARLSGKSPEKPDLREINKMDEMLELVYDGNIYGL